MKKLQSIEIHMLDNGYTVWAKFDTEGKIFTPREHLVFTNMPDVLSYLTGAAAGMNKAEQDAEALSAHEDNKGGEDLF
jgi:hypothetical protein